MATFGERLKELRKEHDLKQKEVAEQIDVASNTVAIWERGERVPESIEMCSRLADLFEVSEGYMLGTTDKRDLSELSDEFGAQSAEEDQREDEEHILKIYRDLSIDMQRALRITINGMWESDKMLGKLQSQQKE